MPEIPKTYEPQSVERKWYQFWLDRGCFTADPGRVSTRRPAYAIVIPPPNVTGVLTLGHVLNNTIQDILARKARMDGHEVLWLPGTDHAGIATQTVVERTLRQQGLLRHRNDLGRARFLDHAWAWKEKHGGIIIEQLKRLGASCDWSRTRFTMDPDYSRCVQKVFVELYRKGLIYRGHRMVNWDPHARTALSDEEVLMTEQRGHLWHIRYPLLDSAGQPRPDAGVVVATTRPETLLGDEAVAVHPADERYAQWIGCRVLLPLQNKPIPVIADPLVDPKFGTGCVKVTPAHDPNDYTMALCHQLPLTEVIGPDGSMTAAAGAAYAGLDRFAARQAVVDALTREGLLVKVEDYTHNVGFSERSQVPIEPHLSDQWFLRYPAVAESTQAVERGHIRFHPERWSKTYLHWMANIKDWCISRQLWWGHRIPVWTLPLHPGQPDPLSLIREYFHAVDLTAEVHVETVDSPAGSSVRLCTACEAADRAIEALNACLPETDPGPAPAIPGRAADLARRIMRGHAAGPATQDPDVLDTWFSSWLWPFATMGWPERNPTLDRFYPTSDLVTGPDIIFFWVARMIMAGYEFMGQPPFRNVYYTGIIRDKTGRKMSKSLGNSPDPLDLIARYGADALRFGTMRSAPLGQDILFDEQNVELGRNFCNKLWNACRFRQMQGGPTEGQINPARLSSDDKWILLRLDRAIGEISDAFAEYRFSDATATLHRFFWGEYCDWYLEAAKAALAPARDPGLASAAPLASPDPRRTNTLAVIDFVLGNTLRLFHPFLPFITEELWNGLGFNADLPPDQGGQTILFARWPKPLSPEERQNLGLEDAAAEVADAKYELVGKARNLRREFNLPASRKLKFILKPAGNLPAAEIEVIRLLLNAESVDLDPDYLPPKGTPSAANRLGEIYLPLAGLVDPAAERARLGRELEKAQAEIDKARTKLDSPHFVQKAPPQVLEEQRRRLADWETLKAKLLAAVDNLPPTGP